LRQLLSTSLGLILCGCCVLGAPAATGRSLLTPCGEDQVPLASTAAAGPKVTGIVAAWTWGTSPCLLNTRLTFVVKRYSQRVSPGGAMRTIAGNPGMARVNVVLKPGAVFAASWRWRNWCGRSGRFQLQPNFRAWPYLAVPSNALRAPACTARGTRSTLVRVPIRLRSCPAGDLRVRAEIGQGFMQSLIVGASVSLRAHRSACLLRNAKVDFALQRQVGGQWTTVQQIAGNPSHRTIGALLAPGGEPAQVFWAWRNWCGSAGPFRPLAHVNGRAVAGATSSDAPSCQDGASPSILAPSFGHS
jgi:hypothetical protein